MLNVNVQDVMSSMPSTMPVILIPVDQTLKSASNFVLHAFSISFFQAFEAVIFSSW